MKVLVIAPKFPSINQPWIDTYLEQLMRAGIDFDIYSVNREGGSYGNKVEKLGFTKSVIDLPMGFLGLAQSSVYSLWNVRQLLSTWSVTKASHLSLKSRIGFFLKSLNFQRHSSLFCKTAVIHSHAEHLAFDFLGLAIHKNLPLVFTFHGLPPSDVGQLSLVKRRMLYKNVSLVITNTKYSARQVAGLGCSTNIIKVMPQGIPLDDFPFLPAAIPASGEVVKLLTVGRYHSDKGVIYSLMAARRLKLSGVNFSWTFIGEGPHLERFLRLRERFDLEGQVEFIGSRKNEEVRSYYQSCNILVLASLETNEGWAETQGVVLQEAQASGCLPVATRTGGIPECVNHMKDGVLVRQRSSRDIADAIQYLIAHPGVWPDFQKNGRVNVERNFSADVIGQKMAETLSYVVGNWRGY